MQTNLLFIITLRQNINSHQTTMPWLSAINAAPVFQPYKTLQYTEDRDQRTIKAEE